MTPREAIALLTKPGFTVEFPPPPSVNESYRNVPEVGRVKTKAYKAWRKAAALTVVATVPAINAVRGLFGVAINLPSKMAGDIDNRAKGIIDALVASGRVDDDKFLEELHIIRQAPGSNAIVVVRAA